MTAMAWCAHGGLYDGVMAGWGGVWEGLRGRTWAFSVTPSDFLEK